LFSLGLAPIGREAADNTDLSDEGAAGVTRPNVTCITSGAACCQRSTTEAAILATGALLSSALWPQRPAAIRSGQGYLHRAIEAQRVTSHYENITLPKITDQADFRAI
jgi:hypothetical protein